jgi:phosphoglucomutase
MSAASRIHPLAGQLPPAASLTNISRLITAYFSQVPDPQEPSQQVSFGTSGHRGSAFLNTFNEAHVVAISQALCDYRRAHQIDGPLFLGIDTHALSEPAFVSALEVFAANAVHTFIAKGGEYTPTPAVSLAILQYNQGRTQGLADGVVITPSHNPPDTGGYKYNPTHGGPADTQATAWIQARANTYLREGWQSIPRWPLAKARQADTTQEYDFLHAYVAGIGQVIDMPAIVASGIRMAVDPLGGAGVNYWSAIAAHYGLNLQVLNTQVDPNFRFMTLDWDGQIRMDPSSVYAMQSVIGLKDGYDIAFACDTDHDRHGIVAPSVGLLPANDYLAVAIDYLFQHRPDWRIDCAVGKTLVSSQMIDRVAQKLQRPLWEMPVGFKWFSEGLLQGTLGFGGEESAGASFLTRSGTVWSTDKDGLAPALLAAEITARTGRDPGEHYRALTQALGKPFADRKDAPATVAQKQTLSRLSAEQVTSTQLAGDPITQVLTRAPANNEPIGGLKVCTAQGWFAARPSGTEDIYKIYAESFVSPEHLERLFDEAQALVDAALR